MSTLITALDSGDPQKVIDVLCKPESETEEAQHARGHWADISLMRLKRPDVIKPIIHMLGLKRPIREIAKVNRVSTATVLAVLNDPLYAPKIQAQREHFTTQARNALRLGIEATVEEYAKPEAKAPPMFDLHLLHQMITLDEGGATSRMEHTFKAPETDAERELMRIVDGTTRNIGPEQARLTERVEVQEAQVMGLSEQKLHALPASTAPDATVQPNIGVIGDCEEMGDDNDEHV